MVGQTINVILILVLASMAAAIPAAAQIPAQHTDAEILGIMAVMDQNEIQAAQLAEQKNVDRAVSDYAHLLDKDHNGHLDKTRRLAQQLGLVITDDSSMADLRARGRADLEALTALDGIPFAQLYIADMIKAHSEALNWIDSQDAAEERLKKFVHETRQTVEMHFKKAQQIQGEQQIGQM